MTALDAPISTITLDRDAPIYAEVYVDVTLAALFATLKAELGMTEPEPKVDRVPRYRWESERRRAVLAVSPIWYAVTAS